MATTADVKVAVTVAIEAEHLKPAQRRRAEAVMVARAALRPAYSTDVSADELESLAVFILDG